MKRQVLTQQQNKGANKVMSLSLAVWYVFFIAIEVSNISKQGQSIMAYVRLGLYAASVLLTGIMVKILGSKKVGTITIAALYAIVYAVLVFGNGAGTLAMAFPAIIGFLIFLNEPLVLAGSVVTFIFSVIKCYLLYKANDAEALGFASVMILGSFVTIWCSRMAVRLLITFSQENQAEIERAAEHRAVVARTVAGIVEKMDEDFNEVLAELAMINEAMNTAHASMNEIAKNSENTVEAINHQADMTGQIQTRLENTSTTAADAKEITEQLKNVIVDGKKQADELKAQSVLVDQNTVKISETVNLLVENVEKVSGIVASILRISSQTNLLALNASIEAARAGEAGKGFAVVADQIRNLAEETKVSTEQITAIINELTAVTDETQTALRNSVESIDIQRQKVEEVDTRFTEVEKGMLELETGVESMSSELGNVMEANRSIVASIATLSTASEEVLAETQLSKENIDCTFESMKMFSETVDGTFEQLQVLKETAVEE